MNIYIVVTGLLISGLGLGLAYSDEGQSNVEKSVRAFYYFGDVYRKYFVSQNKSGCYQFVWRKSEQYIEDQVCLDFENGDVFINKHRANENDAEGVPVFFDAKNGITLAGEEFLDRSDSASCYCFLDIVAIELSNFIPESNPLFKHLLQKRFDDCKDFSDYSPAISGFGSMLVSSLTNSDASVSFVVRDGQRVRASFKYTEGRPFFDQIRIGSYFGKCSKLTHLPELKHLKGSLDSQEHSIVSELLKQSRVNTIEVKGQISIELTNSKAFLSVGLIEGKKKENYYIFVQSDVEKYQVVNCPDIAGNLLVERLADGSRLMLRPGYVYFEEDGFLKGIKAVAFLKSQDVQKLRRKLESVEFDSETTFNDIATRVAELLNN